MQFLRDGVTRIVGTSLAVAVGALWLQPASACPFCSATQQTLSEELKSADAAVLAQLVKAPPPYDPNQDDGASYRALDPELASATFRIIEKLQGGEHLFGVETIEVPYFGEADKEKLFLITAIRTDRLDWTTPLPLSDAAEGYVRTLPDLPEDGSDRLAFFQDYLEHEDPMLAQDAYDEFARAPYDVVIGLKDRMRHDRLVEWIQDVELAPSRRGLYLTMLGVCGKANDLPMLEFFMSPTVDHYKAAADAATAAGLAVTPALFRPALYEAAERYERLKKQGLDAMIACYLTLEGEDGLPLVEELFLTNPGGEFKDTFSAIAAMRFHGDETDAIPRNRLAQSMRKVLDNPTFADLVIADLSRWEDWGVMGRLAQMFVEADKSSYVRAPIATYMLIASEQEGDVGKQAAQHLEKLREVDQQAVDDAERNLGFGLFARAIPRADSQSSGAEGADTAEVTEASQPVRRDAPSSTPEEAEVKVALPAKGDAPPETNAVSPPSEAAGGGESAIVADNQTLEEDGPSEARQVAEAAEDELSIRPGLAPADEEVTDVPPPSRPMIVGGTVLAVAVLAGLFAVLLRGFQ